MNGRKVAKMLCALMLAACFVGCAYHERVVTTIETSHNPIVRAAVVTSQNMTVLTGGCR